MKIIKSFEDTLNKEQKEQFNKIKELIYGYAMANLVGTYDAQIQMELQKVTQALPITKPKIEVMKNVTEICKKRFDSLEKLKDELDLNF